MQAKEDEDELLEELEPIPEEHYSSQKKEAPRHEENFMFSEKDEEVKITEKEKALMKKKKELMERKSKLTKHLPQKKSDKLTSLMNQAKKFDSADYYK